MWQAKFLKVEIMTFFENWIIEVSENYYEIRRLNYYKRTISK